MEGFEWKMVSSMEKVFPVREPSGEGVGEKLTALRGETVSFQIAYRWSGSRREKMHPELCGKGNGKDPEGMSGSLRISAASGVG